MRLPLITSLTALVLVGAPAFAAEEHKADHGNAEKVVAKWDPISGKAVDASVPTEDVVTGKKTVVVGFSSKEDAATFSKADDKAKKHMARAALRHHTVKDGKEFDDKGEEVKEKAKDAKDEHEKKDKKDK